MSAAINGTWPAPPADITHQIHGVSHRPEGYGGYSDIYTGIWSSPSGELKVAVKVVRPKPNDCENQKLRRLLDRELRVWKGLSHPNIQMLCGIYCGIGPLPALVSPWCDNGNIKSFVLRRTSDPSVEPSELDWIKMNLLIGVMSGVQFLHENRIVHGDIKSDNILISDCGAPLVCDFGLSRIIAERSESSTQTGPKGTWRWMAPELLIDGAQPSYETDIWACGCLFIEVWCSIIPYPSKTNQQLILAMNKGEGPYLARPESMPVFVWLQVQECCNFAPEQRPLSSRITQSLSESMLRLTAEIRSSFQLSQAVLSVAWFPDGLRVVVGCRGGSTYTRNLVTGATLRLRVGHTRNTNGVAVSPNGKLIASCSGDRIILWDAETMRARGAPMTGHDREVHSVAFSPDSRHIVSGSSDCTIRVWSAETSTAVGAPFSGHTLVVSSVAYSLDGLRIVSGSWDRTIRIWDATTGRLVGSSPEGQCHTSWVTSVAYSPDGTRIVSGSLDNTIRIWDATTGAAIAKPRRHTHCVSSVAFSPDGRRLASTSDDGTVRIWGAADDPTRWDI